MLVFWMSVAAPALACSLAGPAEFEVDAVTDDDVAPGLPEVVDVRIERGKGPVKMDDGRYMSTSCDDLGFIDITLADPEGEAPDEVGYLLELVEGDLPEGLGLPEVAWKGPTLALSWIDGDTDDQDPFTFVLEITPIDAGGNLGEPVEVPLVDDGIADADEASGCSVVPGAPVGGIWLLAGLLAGMRRRR